MKIKNFFIVGLGLISSTVAFAQESEKIDTLDQLSQKVTLLEDATASSKKLKISGYVQTEWQSSQIDVNGNASKDMKVGAGANAAEKAAAVATPGSTFDRFGVRRGRLKATYTDKGCTGVVYIDATEKGVVLKEAYGTVLDPWVGVVTLKAGIFNRPFGHEIEYSSSNRYAPERSRIIQTLFPSERDLGATITLQAPKSSPLSALKLEAGLLAGNAINLDTKSQKDLIAHLTYNQVIGNDIKLGVGASYYNGNVYQSTVKVYEMSNGAFASVGDSASNKNKVALRQYFGGDLQLAIKSVIGLTSIRAEYIVGTQPGTSSSSDSPNSGAVPTASTFGVGAVAGTDTYIRSFSGGYVTLEQDLFETNFSLVAKYDWYDPNTNIAGNAIGLAGAAGTKTTGKADLAYSTLGLGVLCRVNNNVRLTAYYDMPTNETTSSMSAAGSNYSKVLAANLLTVRLQYKF